MKTLTPEQMDEIAATCYLAIWQSDEFNPVLKPSPGNTELEELFTEPFKQILEIMDYPTDPVYDNESEPCITWKSELYNQKARESQVYEDIKSIYDESAGD